MSPGLLTSRFSLLTSRIAPLISLAIAMLLCSATASAAPPLAPTVTWPPAGAVLGSNRVDVTWSGGAHIKYEIHIGSHNTPTSANAWNSGEVNVAHPGVTTVETPPLAPQQTYYVFIRLASGEGWGPWSAPGRHFYVAGQLVNEPYLVAGLDGAQRVHQMCYNPDRNEYLVGYFDAKVNQRTVVSYYRLDSAGTKIGSEVSVVDDLDGAGGPNMCYNTSQQEYLLSYGGYSTSGGLHSEQRLQRVNAVTGALIGASMRITTPDPSRSAVAWSPVSNRYLLAIEDSGRIWGLMLSAAAAPVSGIFPISNASHVYSGTPRIAYNSADEEFLVVWVVNTQFTWDAYAQRVKAPDGALLGTNITIGDTAATEFPGGVAWDHELNRYLVICAGEPASPWVQFISASGGLIGSRIPVGGGEFDGGMSGIAWNPATREYLATWGHCCSAGNFGRRISQTGAVIGEPFRINGTVQGFGNWDPLPVANTQAGEFLIAWYWQYDDVYVRRYRPYPLPPPDAEPPAPVTNLTLTRYANAIGIQWTNPATPDFAGALVRVKTTGFPASPADGALVVDQANAPGTSDTVEHRGLSRGTYYFAVFAHDEVPNYAAAAVAVATILPGDFDGDGDIDQGDFAHLQACLTADGAPYAAGCRDADLSDDADVDTGDLNLFLPCMGGAEQPPGC